MTQNKQNYQEFMTTYTKVMNEFLEKILKQQVTNPKLAELLAYPVAAGGKRIRPLLFLATLTELHYPITEEELKIAAGIELVHTYSLVHDDLPAMDNDEFRRGQLTVHAMYDDASAILAGDALLTLGISLVAQAKLAPTKVVQVVKQLTAAAGINGMIEGQLLDMMSSEVQVDAELAAYLEYQKTGKLLIVAIQMAAVLAETDTKTLAHLEAFGRDFGRAFQIYDDLVDLKLTTEEAGKKTQKDRNQGKQNLLTVQGTAGAETELRNLIAKMQAEVADFETGILVNFPEIFMKVLD